MGFQVSKYGDARRNPNQNKRRPKVSTIVPDIEDKQESTIETVLTAGVLIGSSIAIIALAIDDASMIGVADDAAISGLVAVIYGEFRKTICMRR